MGGILILCATPIGNLGDAAPRLGEAIESADVVFAEDTRRAGRLLSALGVQKPLRSYFVGNEAERAVELRERLGGGETVALLTDAGTPGVADPGVSAVRAAEEAGATVTIVPGPSAVTAALAVAGFGADRFVFEGFLPRSGTARTERLASIAAERRPVVLFAATGRVAGDLADLAAVCGGQRAVVVARELTKLHEEVWRGGLGSAAAHWGDEVEPRGEFSIVLAPAEAIRPDLGAGVAAVELEMGSGTAMSEAVRTVAEALGLSRRALYEATLVRRKEPESAQ
jgi:16S rRNA (cytidine1402-2'-O)-methyltransferase